jgi:benzoyl-CoA-dihydrodiol lyase
VRFWTLAVARALDDLILDLRTNELELGTWVFRTEGDAARVLAHDELLLAHRDDWLVNEIVHYLKRTLKRLDVTSRSLIALVEPGSCFAGSLLELALAADRSFQLSGVFEEIDRDAAPAAITVAWSRSPRMTSTGTRRCASLSRSAPRSARTPSPGSRRTTASPARRRSRRRSSDG